jgi:uncharacterized protein YbjQ (UPF0145 family)
MLVVTTDSVPGFEIRTVFGEVVGITARTFNPYIEGVKSLNGRLNPELLRLLTLIRQEAVSHMVEAAKRHGANAIVGMRYDVRGVTAAWNEVCAYGTAVLLVPTDQVAVAADPALTDPVGGEVDPVAA